VAALDPIRRALHRGWSIDRRRLALAGRPSQKVLVLASLTGAATGLAVAAFERLTAEIIFAEVMELPLAALALMPLAGLVLSGLALRWLAGGATPATSDEYVRSFHEQGRPLDTRPAPGRMAAAVATLGFGGSMGYEGPAIYAGSSIGSWLQRRLPRFFTTEDAKLLLVAGAAAGVAAIFKAPVTGLVFALEVPTTTTSRGAWSSRPPSRPPPATSPSSPSSAPNPSSRWRAIRRSISPTSRRPPPWASSPGASPGSSPW
jgi:H+/Cl- antiporter ClcA